MSVFTGRASDQVFKCPFSSKHALASSCGFQGSWAGIKGVLPKHRLPQKGLVIDPLHSFQNVDTNPLESRGATPVERSVSA